MKRLILLLLILHFGVLPSLAQGDKSERTHEPCVPTCGEEQVSAQQSLNSQLSTLNSQPNCRPIHSTYALEVGGGLIADTYLSPLRYHGVQLALTGDWTKALPWHRGMSMSFKGRIEGMRLQNPAGNATEWQGAVAFDWLVRRGWQVTDRFTLGAGGGLGLYAGCIYMPRNGNNPAAAKARLALQGTLSASYRLRLGRLPVTVSDEAISPLAGAMFSQDYGQPYYNIYLGNRSGLVHAAWWGNNFCVDNLLGLRLNFSRGDLGVGYRFRLYQQHVCNLDTRIATHAAVISWTPRK